MNATRNILYIASGLIAASTILVFVPWSTLNAFMAWFGPFAFPDDPLVQYTVKVMMLIFFWLGVLMAVAVRRAAHHELILLILGWTFISAGGACLVLGWVYGVPWFFYVDAAVSGAVGVLLVIYRSQVLAREDSAA